MIILQQLATILGRLAIVLSLIVTALLVVIVFWVSLQLDPPRELELFATLFITMGTVITAAFITALLHRLIGPPSSAADTGLVFRESIKRYAWIAAPIASGYGIAQIVRTVAEIIAQTP